MRQKDIEWILVLLIIISAIAGLIWVLYYNHVYNQPMEVGPIKISQKDLQTSSERLKDEKQFLVCDIETGHCVVFINLEYGK